MLAYEVHFEKVILLILSLLNLKKGDLKNASELSYNF